MSGHPLKNEHTLGISPFALYQRDFRILDPKVGNSDRFDFA